MKRFFPFALSLTILILSTYTASAEPRIIRLRDGSTIKGEVLSLNRGVYTIKTTQMGTIQVQESYVLSIASDQKNSTSSRGKNSSNEQIRQWQEAILNNPQVMQDIQNLMQNEEVMRLLADPALRNAVMRGDTDGLRNNPKINQLIQNPDMKKLIEKLQNTLSP